VTGGQRRKRGLIVTGWIAAGVVLLVLALIIEERRGLLAVGDPAPDFTAVQGNGNRFRLADYHGKNPVVLFFYPADFTQGCTLQACAFRDSYTDLQAEGAVIVGISRDDDSSHTRFSQEYHLPYPLISDRDGTIGKAYGIERAWGLLPIPKRVTYVIDKKGIVRAVIHHELLMRQHVLDVREALRFGVPR
jgi:thioredoxin-dependent peroxiredoxin